MARLARCALACLAFVALSVGCNKPGTQGVDGTVTPAPSDEGEDRPPASETGQDLGIVPAHGGHAEPSMEELQDQLRVWTKMSTLSVLDATGAALPDVQQGPVFFAVFVVEAMEHCHVRAPKNQGGACAEIDLDVHVANEAALQLGVALVSHDSSGALRLRALRFLDEAPYSPRKAGWEAPGAAQTPWTAEPNQEASFKVAKLHGGDIDDDQRLEFAIQIDFEVLDVNPHADGCDGECEDYEPPDLAPAEYSMTTAARRRLLILRTDLSAQLDLVVQHESDPSLMAYQVTDNELLLRDLQIVGVQEGQKPHVELRACELDAMQYLEWDGSPCFVDAVCKPHNVRLTMSYEAKTDAYSGQEAEIGASELDEDVLEELCG